MLETPQADDNAGLARHPEACLFCRRRDRDFKSEEHIFPFALGNRDQYVLPAGVVCDPCNNGPLQNAEQTLTSFQPIKPLLAERGIGTRRGHAHVVSNKGTRVWWEAARELRVVPGGKKAMTRTGPSSGSLNMTGEIVTERFMRRITAAVLKIALEFVYLDLGSAVAFEPRFDAARAVALGEGPARGWVIAPKEVKPHNNVRLEFRLDWVVDGRERAPIRLDVYGVEFYSDLVALDLTADELQPPWPANKWALTSWPPLPAPASGPPRCGRLGGW